MCNVTLDQYNEKIFVLDDFINFLYIYSYIPEIRNQGCLGHSSYFQSYTYFFVMQTNYNGKTNPRKTNNDIFSNSIDQGGIQIIKYLIYKMFYSSLHVFFSSFLESVVTFEGSILLFIHDFYVFAKSIFQYFFILYCSYIRLGIF